jgi:hypothetical protein
MMEDRFLNPTPLSYHLNNIIDIFGPVDVSIIDSIIYMDGWSSYEDSGGLIVFYGIDGSIQMIEHAYSVMSDLYPNDNQFIAEEISKEIAIERILHMEGLINGDIYG